MHEAILEGKVGLREARRIVSFVSIQLVFVQGIMKGLTRNVSTDQRPTEGQMFLFTTLLSDKV